MNKPKDDIFQTRRQRDFYLKMLKIKEKENTRLKERIITLEHLWEIALDNNKIKRKK